MALSCDTYFDDGECDWYWYWPSDFTTTSVGRRKRCRSCKQLIGICEDAVEIPRYRYAQSEFEMNFYGEGCEIDMASWWMCEDCGGLMLSLLEHGYALSIDDDMRVLAKEHAALVRIAGDAPCKHALLGRDLDLVRADAWSSPNLAVFTQVVTGRNALNETTRLKITCLVSSLAAFEGQWKMARAAHTLPEGFEWRIGTRYWYWYATMTQKPALGVVISEPEQEDVGDD